MKKLKNNEKRSVKEGKE